MSKQGIPDDGTYHADMGVSTCLHWCIINWLVISIRLNLQPSLMDNYDYVMHGRIFRISHLEGQNIEVSVL